MSTAWHGGGGTGLIDDDPSFWDAVIQSTPALRPPPIPFPPPRSHPPPPHPTSVPSLSSLFPDDFDAAFRQPLPPPVPRPPKRPLDAPPPPPPSKRHVPPFLTSPTPSLSPSLYPSPLTPTSSAAASPASPHVCRDHSLPLKELTVKKAGPNCGRRFLNCAQSPPCNSFQWADTPPSNPTTSRSPSSATPSPSPSSSTLPAPPPPPSQRPREPVVVKFELVDCDVFSLAFSPFSTPLVDHLKAQGGRWHDAARHWLFPLPSYDAILTSLRSPPPSLPPLDLTDDIPRATRKAVLRPLPSPPPLTDETLLTILPPTLATSLLPFQLDGVRFALSKAGRCHLADEMGVGKSVQAIAVMSWYGEDWPVLIVCPSSLRLNWESELLKWYAGAGGDGVGGGGEEGGHPLADRIDVIFSAADRRLLHHRQHHSDRRFICIISYNLIATLSSTLTDVDFGVVIADESHMIKSHDAKRTQALLPLLKRAKRALLLSGTPALNRPSELYTQLHALLPSVFASFTAFGNRYCAPSHNKWGRTYDGGSHLGELHFLLKRYVMIRRMKADVLPQLPPKRRQAVIVDCPNVMRGEMKELERIEQRVNALIADDTEQAIASASSSSSSPSSSSSSSKGGEGRSIKADVMRLFSVTATAKCKVVCEYTLDLLESVDKFLLYYHHQALGDAVAAALTQHSTSFIRIDGSTPPTQRQQSVDLFQSSASHRVALLSITAASTGFTLTAASTVIFAELFWSPAWLLQAEDRVHRIGSSAAMVHIQYILGKHTVDEVIWSANNHPTHTHTHHTHTPHTPTLITNLLCRMPHALCVRAGCRGGVWVC